MLIRFNIHFCCVAHRPLTNCCSKNIRLNLIKFQANSNINYIAATVPTRRRFYFSFFSPHLCRNTNILKMQHHSHILWKFSGALPVPLYFATQKRQQSQHIQDAVQLKETKHISLDGMNSGLCLNCLQSFKCKHITIALFYSLIFKSLL